MCHRVLEGTPQFDACFPPSEQCARIVQEGGGSACGVAGADGFVRCAGSGEAVGVSAVCAGGGDEDAGGVDGARSRERAQGGEASLVCASGEDHGVDVA